MDTAPVMNDHGLTIGFVGYTDANSAPGAREFEDAVLALLPDHGAAVVYRGRRIPGQPDHLPLELHLIWFPSTEAFHAYLDDPRRAALLEQYGDVFSTKHAVELIPLTGHLAR